jgi:hypothetical protein
MELELSSACRRALDLCENDLSEAAQWLVDQGEK